MPIKGPALRAHLDTVLFSSNGFPDAERADTPILSASLGDDESNEVSLVDLLVQASDTIRAERDRADAIEEENRALRAQLDGVRVAYHRAAAQGHTDISGDSLTAYVAQHVVAAAPLWAGGGSAVPPRQRSSSSAVTATTSTTRASSSSGARAASRGSVTAATQSYRQGWEAATTHADAAVLPSPPPPLPPLHEDATSATAMVHEVDTKENVPLGRGRASTSASVQAMACRLRRALAPRPAESVTGDIIHTMVVSLQRDVQAALAAQYATTPANCLRGFALLRVRPCVYQLLTGPPADVKAMMRSADLAGCVALRRSRSPLTATPYHQHYLLYQTTRVAQNPQRQHRSSPTRVHAVVVHLTIDSGALRVMRGGGHVDFLEYLERLLHIDLAATQQSTSRECVDFTD